MKYCLQSKYISKFDFRLRDSIQYQKLLCDWTHLFLLHSGITFGLNLVKLCLFFIKQGFSLGQLIICYFRPSFLNGKVSLGTDR